MHGNYLLFTQKEVYLSVDIFDTAIPPGNYIILNQVSMRNLSVVHKKKQTNLSPSNIMFLNIQYIITWMPIVNLSVFTQ